MSPFKSMHTQTFFILYNKINTTACKRHAIPAPTKSFELNVHNAYATKLGLADYYGRHAPIRQGKTRQIGPSAIISPCLFICTQRMLIKYNIYMFCLSVTEHTL